MRVLRFLGRLLLGLIALAILVGVGGWFWLRGATIAQHSGRLALKGLSAPVEMNRTADGVLHLKAQTDADAFFAMGVAHAQDRLWQMEFQRRVGAGRLSEVLGNSTLETDKFLRTWGMYRAAEQAYKTLDAYSKTALDAYAAGVNAYLASNPPLPIEFRLLGYKPEPWKPADSLVWAKMMAYDLSGNWRGELTRLGWAAKGITSERMNQLWPPYPANGPTILQSEDLTPAAEPTPTTQHGILTQMPSSADGLGAQRLLEAAAALPRLLQLPGERMARASNNWVISGSRTTTGKPLLANDPHLSLGAPSIWYLVDMDAPSYKAIGASFPGLPAVVIGRNDRIGWGVTTVGADVQDLYVMDDVGDSYRYKGALEPYRIRQEIIKIKGQAPITLTVRESRYGPIINDVVKDAGAKPLALRWTALDPDDTTIEAFLGLARSQNWEQFKGALSKFVVPSQNFVYADVDGNIGYMAPARFPIRREGHDGSRPVPGDGNWDWQGYLPQSQWPQVYNPKEGFIVTANNKVTVAGYPHTLGLEWEQPYRAARIREMILSKDKLSLEDMMAMQADTTSLLYRAFKPVLEVLNPLTDKSREWKTRLLAWDGVVRTDQLESTVFEAWYTEMTRLGAQEVGKEFWEEPGCILNAMRQGDPACDLPDTETHETCVDFAALSLDKALDRLGDKIPLWGQVHQASFPHSVLTHVSLLSRFSDRSIPHPGDRYTVDRGSYDPKTFKMIAGSSYREVLDFSNLENFRFIHPLGQSGALLSGQYDSLLKRWAAVDYLPMRMNETGFSEHQTLEPLK